MKHSNLHRSPPTFLGIGSMRCGSTWLYRVLKCHPDIHMSEIKEVDFFFRRRMLRRNFEWYEALFRTGQECDLKPIRGEISPGYARLKAWQVNRIAKLFPDLRIVLTLRHPIERVWSQTLYDFGHLTGRDVRTVGSINFLRQVERARSRLSSDYFRIAKVWSDAFGREALHIGFFEDLRNNPQAFVNDVLEHIRASTPWALPQELINKKVWATGNLVQHELEIPEVLRWYIADQLFSPIEQLNGLLDGRVSHWVDELRLMRGRTRFSWRVLKEVNRTIFALPERLAYGAYHVVLDARLCLRWRHLQNSYISTKSETISRAGRFRTGNACYSGAALDTEVEPCHDPARLRSEASSATTTHID